MKRAAFYLMVGMGLGATGAAADDYRLVDSKINGAPAHRIPLSASEIADARMREILADKLADTLQMEEYGQEDLDRLLSLADLQDAADMEKDPALNVSEAAYADMPLEESMVEQAALNTGPALDPEQMQALAFMVSAMSNPEILAMMQNGISADTRSAPMPEQPRELRSAATDQTDADASILLRGWSVALRPDGKTRLYQPGNPGSEIELEPGIVIGALGAVEDIRQIGREVYVSFESGDSISGKVDLAFSGIPPLPPMSDITEPREELLLSAPAMPNPRVSTSNTEETP